LKYVARPVETEAVQFTGENWQEVNEFVGEHQIDEDAYMANFIPVWEMWVDIPDGITALVWVEPSKQWAGVKNGDYLVKDSAGDFYPCDKTIFEAKYTPLNPTVEVNANVGGGVITASQIEKAIGRSIQQSSRFR